MSFAPNTLQKKLYFLTLVRTNTPPKRNLTMLGTQGSKKKRDLSEKFTSWVGSPASLFWHTVFFTGIFVLYLIGIPLDRILLVLTTAVSLEAIYLSIFIQMTVNRTSQSLQEVEEDVADIVEDVQGLEKGVSEIMMDVDAVQKDIDKIEGGVAEMAQDLEEIQEDGEQDDIDEAENRKSLDHIEDVLHKLIGEIESIKNHQKNKPN